MYKITYFLLLLVLLPAKAFGQQADTILLFHPSVSNIKTISYLLENEILDLKDVHFKGVYYSLGAYDYALSEKHIDTNRIVNFSLEEINESLPADQLFETNACSDHFLSLYLNSAGAIFMGGPDIPPHTYQEPAHLLTRVTDPGRHYLELSYLFHLLGGKQNKKHKAMISSNKEYAVLGICLGMQTINVATGGTMVQDIPQEIYSYSYVDDILESKPEALHRNYYPDDPLNEVWNTGYHFHPIRITASSDFLLETDYNCTPHILSAHHQCIKEAGKGIMILATSMDGKVIEAITHKKYKSVIGVQFHPEKTGLFNSELEFQVSKDSSINFNKHLIEKQSMDFHLSFWKEVAEIFN